jgi:hypothetical protein
MFAVGNEHGTRHKLSLPCVQRQTLGKNETHGKMTILSRAALGEEKALGLTLVAVNCSQRRQLLPWISTQHSAK